MATEIVRLSAGMSGTGYQPFWSKCVGAGRAAEGLRLNWQEHLDTAHRECGFEYCRFHGLFHDDMFPYHEDAEGNPVYNFQYIDELFDRMLERGVRPFVEFGFMPRELAANDGTTFWWKGRTAPPKDFNRWGVFIEAFLRHLVRRYGREELRRWYFEVWNEPNLNGFWHGTRSEYFELYRHTARAVKAVDPEFRVGGPATSNFVPDERFDGETEDVSKQQTFRVEDIDQLAWHGVWIEAFLDFCAREKLPVDFVSTHPYPTDFALDGHGKFGGLSRKRDSVLDDLRWLKQTVARSAYPQAELHLTEWNSSPTPRDHMHDQLPLGAYIVRTNLECIGLVDSLSFWVFTDCFEEGGAGDSIFHGGFGLINFQGIKKPAFHAYRMLHALGTEMLLHDETGVMTRDPESGKLRGLYCNYPADFLKTPPICRQREQLPETINWPGDLNFELEVTDLKPGTVVEAEFVDRDSGFAFRRWEELGCPEPPTREETRLLREAAEATRKVLLRADEHGILRWQTRLQPWALLLLKEL